MEKRKKNQDTTRDRPATSPYGRGARDRFQHGGSVPPQRACLHASQQASKGGPGRMPPARTNLAPVRVGGSLLSSPRRCRTRTNRMGIPYRYIGAFSVPARWCKRDVTHSFTHHIGLVPRARARPGTPSVYQMAQATNDSRTETMFVELRIRRGVDWDCDGRVFGGWNTIVVYATRVLDAVQS